MRAVRVEVALGPFGDRALHCIWVRGFVVRMSEFQRACAAEFGADYCHVLIRDHWVAVLGGTAQEALARGVAAREVWQALCVELEVPLERRYGRGLVDPRDHSR